MYSSCNFPESGFELLSASLVEAVCQDSKVLQILKFLLSIILVFSKSIRWLLSLACFAMLEALLVCFTFLTCSDFLVLTDFLVSPM